MLEQKLRVQFVIKFWNCIVLCIWQVIREPIQSDSWFIITFVSLQMKYYCSIDIQVFQYIVLELDIYSNELFVNHSKSFALTSTFFNPQFRYTRAKYSVDLPLIYTVKYFLMSILFLFQVRNGILSEWTQWLRYIVIMF